MTNPPPNPTDPRIVLDSPSPTRPYWLVVRFTGTGTVRTLFYGSDLARRLAAIALVGHADMLDSGETHQ